MLFKKNDRHHLLTTPVISLLCLVGLLTMGFGLLGGTTADAAIGINQRLNFQGRFFDATGAVLPDGNYNVEFKIVQDGDGCNPTSGTFPCGGTVQWTETRTGSNRVTIKNGYFSVELGSVTGLPITIWDQDTLWLSVNMGGTSDTPTWDGEMKPLKRLSSSPYSFNSKFLDGLAKNDYVQLAQGVQTDSSNSNISIAINKTGSAALLQLQQAGLDVFALDNSGSLAATYRGTATAALFDATNSSANGLSVDVQSSSTSQYSFKVTSGNGTVNAFYVRADGSVGIGTTTPNTTLQVVSTTAGTTVQQLQLSNSAIAANTGTGIDFNMSTSNTFVNASIRSQRTGTADGNLQFYTHSGSALLERMRIFAAGNIGIATTTIGAGNDLQIGTQTAVATANPRMLSLGGTYSSTAGTNQKLKIYDDGTNVMGIGASAGQFEFSMTGFGAADFVFYTRGNEALRIVDTTGWLGVGTVTDPDRLLTIAAANATTSQINLRSARAAIVSGNVIGGMDFFSNDTSLTAPGSQVASIQALASATHTTTVLNTDLVFSTKSGTTLSEAMRITSSNNVGIGTSTPDLFGFGFRTLTIQGAATRAVVELSNSNTGTTGVAGSVGGLNGSTVLGTMNIWADGATNSGFIDFWTSSAGVITEKMRITSAGNVGIGTTVPQSRVQITGGGLCVGSDANCNTDNNTQGVIYSSSSLMTVYDVAENYPTKDPSIEPGDIITLDREQGIFVKKSISSYDPNAIGAISEEPGLLLGGFNGQQFKEERQVAVALSGRITIKVNAENGPIKIGDYITTSSIPGIGMKATKSGPVIGRALEDWTPDSGKTKVMVFVGAQYADPNNLMASLTLDSAGELVLPGLDTEADTTAPEGTPATQPKKDLGWTLADMMKRLLRLEGAKSPTTSYSAEPNATGLTMDELQVNTISSATEENITIQLSDGKSLVIDTQTEDEAIRFDDKGNAFFKGTITADKIRANQIEGLEVLTDHISSLEQKISSQPVTSATVTQLAEGTESDAKPIEQLDKPVSMISLTVLGQLEVKGGLVVSGPVRFDGQSIFAALAEFHGQAVFKDQVTFGAHTVFGQDAGGTAVIKQGADRVDVQFTRPYTHIPRIVASLKAQPGTEELLLKSGYSYLTTNITAKGFTIVLNKPALQDISLDWLATSIKNAKITESTTTIEGINAENQTSINQGGEAETETDKAS